MALTVSRDEFEELVREAILDLPPELRTLMDNVALTTADYPTPQQQRRAAGGRGLLLGLYEGVPRSKRGPHYTLALPDKITIFQKPLEAVSGSREDLREQVKNTVWHEIAHHFGFDEPGARRAARKRSRKTKL